MPVATQMLLNKKRWTVAEKSQTDCDWQIVAEISGIMGTPLLGPWEKDRTNEGP